MKARIAVHSRTNVMRQGMRRAPGGGLVGHWAGAEQAGSAASSGASSGGDEGISGCASRHARRKVCSMLTRRRHRIAVARAAKSLLHAALNSTMKFVWP
jgi:hypothetical protein